MFEVSGKLFFQRIRPFFLVLTAILPIVLSLFLVYTDLARLDRLETHFFQIQTKARKAFVRKERKNRFLHRHASADHFFLDTKIESLQFLNDELLFLQKLATNPGVVPSKALSLRLEFLSKGENRLQFREEYIKTNSEVKETIEKQIHPVQMTEGEFKQVLSLLEDRAIDNFLPNAQSPQFVIKNLEVERKKTELDREVLEVDLELIKREFGHS